MEYEKCNDCGDLLDKEGKCSCGKFYVYSKEKCPECGSLIFCYNDPSMDSTLGDYCTNKKCNFQENQFMSWEEIKREN